MQDGFICEAYSDNTTILYNVDSFLNCCPLSGFFVSKIDTRSCCSIFLMYYVVRMLFFGLALLIAARPGLDNPGCYRDGWDIFRGICEGITFVLLLGSLFVLILALLWYVAASGICSIYSCLPYVGVLSQYVHHDSYTTPSCSEVWLYSCTSSIK